jgi:plasmid stabilization system protein ParE
MRPSLLTGRAADSTTNRILDALDRLAMFPGMGRKGSVPGTREWVIKGLP